MRHAVLCVALCLLASAPLAVPAGAAGFAAAPPPLLVAGVAGQPGRVQPLSAEAAHGTYLPGSNVLRRPDGSLVLSAGPERAPYQPVLEQVRTLDARLVARVAEAVAADRTWLAAGHSPGRTAAERDMVERALLDLRLLMRPDGAVVAAERGYWRYVWPRDAAWVAAALSVTGHRADALRALRWIAGVQGADGTWEARYHPGGGRPVQDGRAAQLDSAGWVPWAVWMWAVTGPRPGGVELRRLWPMVEAAADAASRSLRGDGLPPAGADYWETTDEDRTIGTAAALLAGLRSAAAIAELLDEGDAGERWGAAADRLSRAVREHFGRTGYHRTPSAESGADAAVAWLAPPFAAYDGEVAAAVAAASARLLTPSGGLRPGEGWGSDPTLGWTPATGFVMLAAAASGQHAEADEWLAWMAAHRTPVGALPEKVDAAGRPASVAPLAWADALVLLTLVARDEGLPQPSASPRASSATADQDAGRSEP